MIIVEVTELLRRRFSVRCHTGSSVLSQYVDGELGLEERRALETHLHGCARCRQRHSSLAKTVRELGTIRQDAPTHIADSVIAALRAENVPAPARPARRPDLRPLSVVRGADRASQGDRTAAGRAHAAWAALRYCLSRPQLRLTLPIAGVAASVLAVVNDGGRIFHGRVDLGMCEMCAIDFLVAFIALNLVVVMLLRVPGRRRT